MSFIFGGGASEPDTSAYDKAAADMAAEQQRLNQETARLVVQRDAEAKEAARVAEENAKAAAAAEEERLKAEADKAAQAAADDLKKRRGVASTITNEGGAAGLTAAANVARKTLLG